MIPSDELRQKIANDVAAYLASGKQIRIMPHGATAIDPATGCVKSKSDSFKRAVKRGGVKGGRLPKVDSTVYQMPADPLADDTIP